MKHLKKIILIVIPLCFTIALFAQPKVKLSRNNAIIAEATADICTFMATLSATSADVVTINLAFSGSAAGGGIDYTASANSITIPAGSLMGSITVTAVNDILSGRIMPLEESVKNLSKVK